MVTLTYYEIGQRRIRPHNFSRRAEVLVQHLFVSLSLHLGGQRALPSGHVVDAAQSEHALPHASTRAGVCVCMCVCLGREGQAGHDGMLVAVFCFWGGSEVRTKL